MDLQNVWSWYAFERLGPNAAKAKGLLISPSEGMELLWVFNPLFTPRMDAINATTYSTANDEEADGALANMARDDSFESWELLTAGAWRVLAERFLYAQTVIATNMAAGTAVISRLPEGLAREAQSRTLLLQFLLGGARTIDPRILRGRSHGSLPAFPSSTMLKRQ